jgi:hypothetical protein
VKTIIGIWAFFVVGAIINLVQVLISIPDTVDMITPFWLIKGISIFLGPVGSIFGYVGLFQ